MNQKDLYIEALRNTRNIIRNENEDICLARVNAVEEYLANKHLFNETGKMSKDFLEAVSSGDNKIEAMLKTIKSSCNQAQTRLGQ